MWIESLAKKDWSSISSCKNVDEMVKVYQKNIDEALNEVAPVKSFTIRSQYRFGLSDATKQVMHDRDVTRGKINTNNMMYILFTISKESRKNFYPRQDLNPEPRPQSKSDDLDRSAIGPII